MTDAEKLTTIKVLLDDGTGYLPSDTTLTTYITLAANEILYWRYHLVGGVPVDVSAVPAEYEPTQIYAVVAGYTQAGAEGESHHHENGTVRIFRYEDMMGYIRNHVLPYARVGAVNANSAT